MSLDDISMLKVLPDSDVGDAGRSLMKKVIETGAHILNHWRELGQNIIFLISYTDAATAANIWCAVMQLCIKSYHFMFQQDQRFRTGNAYDRCWVDLDQHPSRQQQYTEASLKTHESLY